MNEIGSAAQDVLPMRIDVVSLFPFLFANWLQQGVVARAVDRHLVDIVLTDLRQHGVGRHRVADDAPFGGGAGMVMKVEPIFSAVLNLPSRADTTVILLSPRGRRFEQKIAGELSRRSHLVLVAGHYEGIDERVRQQLVTDEISIGDYVLSNGELAAMVVVDAVVRLLPGAIASESTHEESFQSGLLEYPQYTRPAVFRGWQVPAVLTSGNHAAIAAWRREQSLRATFLNRPDLLESASLSEHEIALVAKWSQENGSGDPPTPLADTPLGG